MPGAHASFVEAVGGYHYPASIILVFLWEPRVWVLCVTFSQRLLTSACPCFWGPFTISHHLIMNSSFNWNKYSVFLCCSNHHSGFVLQSHSNNGWFAFFFFAPCQMKPVKFNNLQSVLKNIIKYFCWTKLFILIAIDCGNVAYLPTLWSRVEGWSLFVSISL